jgi:hypothetical protein
MKKLERPIPETTEVNHHSFVIRVYRRGDAGQWFATVAEDCIQTFRGSDSPDKLSAIQQAARWLAEKWTKY